MTDGSIPYKSPAKLAKALNALLWTQLPLHAGFLAVAIGLFGVDPDAEPTDDNAMYYLAALALVVVYVLVFLPTAVLFCVWFYRVQQNLRVVGDGPVSRSPAWAVGSIFVPIANLIVPYRAAVEAWTLTDPSVVPDRPRTMDPKVPPLLSMWWSAWISGNLATRVSGRLDRFGDSPDVHVAASWLSIAGAGLGMIALVLCVRVVRTLTNRQEARARLLVQPAAPPVSQSL